MYHRAVAADLSAAVPRSGTSPFPRPRGRTGSRVPGCHSHNSPRSRGSTDWSTVATPEGRSNTWALNTDSGYCKDYKQLVLVKYISQT